MVRIILPTFGNLGLYSSTKRNVFFIVLLLVGLRLSSLTFFIGLSNYSSTSRIIILFFKIVFLINAGASLNPVDCFNYFTKGNRFHSFATGRFNKTKMCCFYLCCLPGFLQEMPTSIRRLH